jgi:polyvinyl alcohol dehydrogenase (cytochrome)
MVPTLQLQARRIFVVALLTALTGVAPIVATGGGGPDWGMIGNDPANSRNQPQEHRIGPRNVHRLAPKWVATTAGDVSATPAGGRSTPTPAR